MITITEEIKNILESNGVTTHHSPGFSLPRDCLFEPPCSFKWMNIDHSIKMGAFSYAVSGYYFACEIGRYCSIGEGVQIGRHSHPLNWFSTSPLFYLKHDEVLGKEIDSSNNYLVSDFNRSSDKSPIELKITKVENDVYIGHGAFIMPGVTLGTGCVVGANSVVTKDVPPYAIVVGSPAKVTRYRFSEEIISLLIDSKWWEYAPWQLKGISCDDIGKFIEIISIMKNNNEPKYENLKIHISDFV
jgi:virginiamycin A acetyltransferase